MFDTLLVSNASPGRRAPPALAATILHIVIILSAVHATAAAPPPIRAVVPDTIRFEIGRPLEPAPRHATSGMPQGPPSWIPAPPSPPEVPPGAPPLEVPRLDLGRMDVAALSLLPSGRDSMEPPGAILRTNSPLAMNEVDQLPQLAEKLEPRYPEPLRAAGVTGGVLLEYVIQRTGRVEPTSVRVIASDHPAFSRSAREAILRARFTPARRAGQTVAVLVRQSIRFQNR